MSAIPSEPMCNMVGDGWSASWTLCSSVRTAAAQMTPPSDDTVMIRIMFYKEALHTFNGDVAEGWMIPTSPTKAITVRLSEFLNHNAETIEQTPSGSMMVVFINSHVIPEFVPGVVSKIIHLVQSSIGSETKGFVDVRIRETLEIRHLLEDQADIDSMRGFLKATRRGTCAICINDYEIGHDNGVRLSCSHGFHGTCISEWLVIKPSCPICSAPLPSPQIVLPWFNPPVQEGIWLSHSSIQSQSPAYLERDAAYLKIEDKQNQNIKSMKKIWFGWVNFWLNKASC